MRCDGAFDCERTGLSDFSDELDCPPAAGLSEGACGGPDRFRCSDGKSCVARSFVCDGFNDCPDASDESPATCQSALAGCELACDNRCLKASLRCDGVNDCSSGQDEIGCPSLCTFSFEFQCRLSAGTGRATDPRCVPQNFVCDGVSECQHGEDEVCAIDRKLCATDAYWTCKSGRHCIRAENRCDGLLHCPDGSDERGCPAPSTTLAPSAGPPMPTSLERKAAGPSCPAGRRFADGACRDVDECAEEFGSCDHACRNTDGGYSCSCLPGYLPDVKGGRRCVAIGAAKLLFSTEAGIRLVDSDTGSVAKLPPSGPELKLAKFLDFDASRGLIFFHTRDGLVGSHRLDSAGQQPIVLMRNSVLDAIAYDWTRALLFYSVPEAPAGLNSSSGGIGVLNVDSGKHAWLARLTCPRGLAADPASGLLYISLWCGKSPGLYTMRMDGSELRPIIVGGRASPGHIALDSEQGRIYWMDMALRGVYSAKLDGSDQRAIWHMGPGYDGVPLGLAQFEDRLLWSDLRAGAVFSIDKFSGQPMKQVLRAPAGSRQVLSAVVYHSAKQVMGGRAGSRRCNCSGDICIRIGDVGAPVCLCDDASLMRQGVCVPSAAKPDAAGLNVQPNERKQAPVAAESVANHDDSMAAEQRQSVLIAAVTVSVLLICLVAGVALAVVCLRRHHRMWRGVGGSGVGVGGGSSASEGPGLPKINSRSKLTAHEVNQDEDQDEIENSC